MSVNLYKLNKYVLYYPMNTFKLHSTKKVKLYWVAWVEFYILGGIIPRDHLVTWLRDIASLRIDLSLKPVQISPPIFAQFCEKLIFCFFPLNT